MKIQFNRNLYTVIDIPNILPTRLQVTIEKEGFSFDEIISDTVDTEEITVFDNEGSVISVYTGFTKRIAICIYPDNSISVELENVDVQQQINTINATLTTVQNVQDTNSAAIAGLGEAVTDLTDSQETQDLAIEDLAEAVSDLTPEE